MDVLSGKKKKEEMKKLEEDIQELSGDELDSVNGAGDPFEKIPRVPNSAIDPDLRNNV